MHPQLTLDLQLKESFTFDNYLCGKNALVLSMLADCINNKDQQQIFIWGDSSTGKSHLLQACCHLAAQKKRSISYLPLKQCIEYPLDILQGLEQMEVLCIDDVQQTDISIEWQEALFNLINRMRENNNTIIFAANLPPNELNLKLEDLRSRLNWGPVVSLKPLNDNEKNTALQNRAQSRGFELSEAVASYILKYYSRDFSDLLSCLDKLDQASLSHQRKLTIPFVKSVFM